MVTNNLHEPFLSAYRPNHSTETALLRVQNNLILALSDKKAVAVLVMLDLSSAFDTVDHTILLQSLSAMDVRGQALAWVQSYLANRTQCVFIGGHSSGDSELVFGVPPPNDRSLGLFCSRYTAGQWVTYVATTALTTICSPSEQPWRPRPHFWSTSGCAWWTSKHSCRRAGCVWMMARQSWLCCHHLQTATDSTCQTELPVGNCMITPVPAARDIVVVIDSHVQKEQHISAVCRAAYSQLHAIAHICSCLTQSSAATLALSLMISKLDYGNCLLTVSFTDCSSCRTLRLGWCAGWRRMIA